MLILTRRTGESLRIGDQIEVVVLGTKGNQIRIGIEAPKSVHVLRSELTKHERPKHRASEDVSETE